ncbi:MAG: hypothetical protein U0470_13580 [Anaerolineae bacterium]
MLRYGAATRMLLHGAAAGGAPDGFVIVRHRRGASGPTRVPRPRADGGARRARIRGSLIGDAIVAVGQEGATAPAGRRRAENAGAARPPAVGLHGVRRRHRAAPRGRRAAAPAADAAAFDRLIAAWPAQGHRPALSALIPADPSPADRPRRGLLARMASAPPRRRFGRERWRAWSSTGAECFTAVP